MGSKRGEQCGPNSSLAQSTDYKNCFGNPVMMIIGDGSQQIYTLDEAPVVMPLTVMPCWARCLSHLVYILGPVSEGVPSNRQVGGQPAKRPYIWIHFECQTFLMKLCIQGMHLLLAGINCIFKQWLQSINSSHAETDRILRQVRERFIISRLKETSALSLTDLT